MRIMRLKPGKSIAIPRDIFMDMDHPPGFSSIDWVMEAIPGSSYEYKYHETCDGNVVFSRRESPLKDGLRTYVSPDRRDLFSPRFDGLFEQK